MTIRIVPSDMAHSPKGGGALRKTPRGPEQSTFRAAKSLVDPPKGGWGSADNCRQVVIARSQRVARMRAR